MEWIALGLVALAVAALIVTYNTLVTLRARAARAYAEIDVRLKQRRDLVPNLMKAVEGYASHERGTLEAVVQARSEAVSARDPRQQASAEAALNGTLGRLMALAESYPDLKADQNFQRLQTDLAEVEDNLAAARRFFNNAVSEYNAAVR